MFTQYSDNDSEFATKLDKLSGCSFSSKAGVENSPPPQAVAHSIGAVNELVASSCGSTYTPIGTLEAFYKYSSDNFTYSLAPLSGASTYQDANPQNI